MKNLKKVLAFVVVFAMMLTCSVSAATFPDVAEDAAYAEAATVLSSLELMIGDDMGNFNPEKILTRAEATALIMRAKGLESAAAGAAGATQFNDVPATHWASGYINLAAQSNVVNGYGDGNFGPEDEVKYEQFVKMVVAALDYEPKANLYGGYPSGYLIIASQKDITKSVPGTAGQPVPRRTVAQILFNALDVGMMELTLDNKGTVTYTDGYDTLLKTYLYINQYEGVLENVVYTTDSNGDINVTVGGNWKGVSAGVYGQSGNVSVAQADTNAETLRGYTVAAYVATDAITGKPYLKAIAPKTGKNDVVVVDYTQLDAAKIDDNGTANDATDDTILAAKYFADPSDYTSVELPLAPNYKKVYNNSAADGYGATIVDDFMVQANGQEVVGKATFINNDMDDSYDYVFVSSYGLNDVVDAIDAVNGTIAGKQQELVDIAEKNSIWTFIKGEEVVDFEDIAVGNVLSIQEGKLGTYTINTVYVSDTVIEGAATEKRVTGTGQAAKTWYTIGTEEYHDLNGVVHVGDEGKFYLNVDNKIIYAEAIRAGADNYAVLLDAAINTQGIGSGAVEVKFLTIDGEWKVAQVADRVAVKFGAANAQNYDSAEVANDATVDLGIYTIYDDGTDADVDGDGNVDEVKDIKVTAANDAVFQYELNSAGKISKIYMPAGSQNDDEFSKDATNNQAIYKASTDKLGSVYLGENTKVFHIDGNYGSNKEERISIASKAIFSDEEAYDVDYYDFDLEGYPTVLVVRNANPGIDIATHPLVLTRVVDATNEAGYSIKKYYGLQAGQEVQVDSIETGVPTVTCKFLPGRAGVFTDDGNADNDYVINYTLAAGDVVLFALDAKGCVKSFELLMSAADARTTATNADLSATVSAADIAGTFAVDASVINPNTQVTKAAKNTFGYASKTLTNGRVILNYVDNNTVKFNTEILRGQDLYFYNVNLNRANNVAVSTASLGAIETSNKADKAGSWVFVREYDGAPVCVVVYTYNNTVAVDVETDSNNADFGALNGAVEAQ